MAVAVPALQPVLGERVMLLPLLRFSRHTVTAMDGVGGWDKYCGY
jgi:hypothetical protein